MRYCQKASVGRVQEHLATLGIKCHVSALQTFLRRMLTEFPSSLVETYQVDLRLLQAVRRRLQLPIHPARRRRDIPKRALPRFICVGALAVRPREPAQGRSKEGRSNHPQIFHGHTSPPAAVVSRTQMEADVAGREPTAAQWRAISRQALAKLPDHVCPWEDRVIDTRTRRPISQESLVADYGLSPREAKAIFLNP